MSTIGSGADDLSPERAAEIRRRLAILRVQLEQGKVHFAPHLVEDMGRSLAEVRYGHDGEVDLSTVDARVRGLALAVTVTKDREDLKAAVSLKEIQTEYFEWLGANFGHLFKTMRERRLNPHQAGRAASADADFVREIVALGPQFTELLTAFWSDTSDAAYAHLEDVRTLKVVFGGDLFPSAYQNIASTCGIYADTIILPDPFLRSAELFRVWSPEQQTYYFVKHALNVLTYRELALADVEPPIVVVLPDRAPFNEDERQFVFELARADAATHASALFGASFASFEEVLQFVDQFESVDQAVGAVVRPDRLLFDTEWAGTPQQQIERMLREHPEMGKLSERPARIIPLQAVGRMAQANDLLLKTQRLGGTPLIDAPTSWKYFQWKLEYDSERLPHDATAELHVVRGLQTAAGGPAQWLGRVPPDALIELRRERALPELRNLLAAGVEEIATSAPADFRRTAEQVLANIERAVAEHERQLRDLKAKKWRFALKDIGSWVVVGSIEVAAAATGTPLFGLSALAGNQLLNVPKLRDIPPGIRRLFEESKQLRRSPVGLLFRYRG